MLRFNCYTTRIICLIIVQFFLNAGLSAQDDKTDNSESIVENKNDSTKNRKMTFSGYPYAYYTPETQLAFGAGGILIFYTSKHEDILPSKVTLGAWYSTNKQYKITLTPIFYFMKNDLYVSFPASLILV